MKQWIHIFLGLFLLTLLAPKVGAQTSNSPAPYCNGGYSSGTCNQGGPSNTQGNSVNDFIDDFATSGASGNNISNLNSGCNGNPNNYISYCNQYLLVSPGDVITCTVQSGIIYGQGFAIWVDWNQDNTFGTNEQVAATTGVPAAATPTVLTFTVPANQPNGAYRLRVRCSFSTPGTNITPCGGFTYGETEDYTLYIGTIPANAGVVTATATGNATICAGQTINLGVTANSAVSYTWTGPNSFSSTIANPTITNATPAASGIYTVVTSGGCPAAKTVTVLVAPSPNFVLTPSVASICQGNIFNASVQFINVVNPTEFNYNWSCNAPIGTFQSPAPGPGIYSPGSQNTLIGPGAINGTQATLIYTVVVSPTVISCPVAHTMTVVINNPVTPSLTLPAYICSTSTVQLQASPGGGTWSANQAVQPNGVFNGALVPPNVYTNTVTYSVAVGGSCIVANSGSFVVAQWIAPILTSSTTQFCGTDTASFNLMGIVQNTTGSWSGNYVTNNIFKLTPTVSPPQPYGTYTLALTYGINSVPSYPSCHSSTVMAISVFNPSQPNITPIPTLCNNSGTIQLTATPTIGGLWSGAGVSALTGVLSPTNYPAGGTYSVAYQYGINGCLQSDTTYVQISEFHTAALSGTINELCFNSNPVNLMSVVQNSLGYWTGGTNTNSLTNTFNPSMPFPLTTGIYTLTYTNPSWPNTTLCPDTRTITVSLLNPSSASIVQVGPYCNTHASVHLSVTPNAGAWTASSYLTSNGLFSPSLAPVGSNIVQYVIGTNTCNTQQSATINIEAFIPATILDSIPDQCITGSAVNLVPFTVTNQGVWSGPGIQGASFNPAVSGTGHMVLSYSTASSPSGLCPDQATIAVNVYSLATPVFVRSGPFCSSSLPLELPVIPVGGVFGGANTNAINAQGLFVPAIALIGDNIVNYSITVGPCVSYAQTTISVERFVSAGFINTAGPYCNNDEHLSRNLNEIVLNPGGTWSGPGVNAATGVFTFTNANIGDNNVIIYGTHSVPTASLCPDTQTTQITVYNTPTVSVSASPPSGCAPMNVVLTPNTNYGIGSWLFSDSSSTREGLGITHIFNTPGSYSVAYNYSIMVAADFMCVARARLNGDIKVFETPKADFSFAPDEILISDPLVHFTNTSTESDHNRYTWTISGANNESQLYDIDPDYTFPQVGDYNVTLRAVSLNGCKSDTTKKISVKSTFHVYIPSSFTPNNDGLNDGFMPVFSEYGLDENTYDLQIFDRWGVLLFETKEYDQAWNGRIAGHPVKQDVYVYKLRFKDVDGNIYNKNGFVTALIR